jgi:hypothetical protein
MTLTASPAQISEPTPLTYDLVAMDLYRDIHKAIRAELFQVTLDAGRTDPSDATSRQALAGHVADVARLLIEHADHEDRAIQPVLERELPDMAELVETDHHDLEARIEGLRDMAATDVVSPATGGERRALHRLYVELASFTSAYLSHQDSEERDIMPALQTAVGIDAVVAIHGAIVGPMPPEELARSLALMLPAMNIEDRTEFMGGMAASAPSEVVEGVWGLAASVLEPVDMRALSTRLGRATN